MNQWNHNMEDVNDMEDAAKYTIITLEDEEEGTFSSQNAQILTDCKEAVTKLYMEFREWLRENQESAEVQARKEKLKQESDRLIQRAKEQMQKLQENENLCYAVNKGIQAAADTGSWVMHTLGDGVRVIRNSESGQKVQMAVHNVANDDRVKKGVASFKKGTLRVAESAFEGLKKVLDDEHNGTKTEESETEVLKHEENNNL